MERIAYILEWNGKPLLENPEKEIKAAKAKGSLSNHVSKYTDSFCTGKICKNQGECWGFNMHVRMEGNSERILHEFPGYKLYNFFISELDR